MKPCYSAQGALVDEVNLKLNNKIILADIEGFKKRITAAKVKLAKLNEQDPSGWKERKRLKAKRQALDAEIVHVNSLIAIARSALDASGGERALMRRGTQRVSGGVVCKVLICLGTVTGFFYLAVNFPTRRYNMA